MKLWEVNLDDPNEVRDMLSDLDWYSSSWDARSFPFCSSEPQEGHHPVSGKKSDGTGWSNYMIAENAGGEVAILLVCCEAPEKDPS